MSSEKPSDDDPERKPDVTPDQPLKKTLDTPASDARASKKMDDDAVASDTRRPDEQTSDTPTPETAEPEGSSPDTPEADAPVTEEQASDASAPHIVPPDGSTEGADEEEALLPDEPATDIPSPDAPAADPIAPDTRPPAAPVGDSPAPIPEDDPAPDVSVGRERTTSDEVTIAADTEQVPDPPRSEAESMAATMSAAPGEAEPPESRAVTMPPGAMPASPVSRPACSAALFGKMPQRGDFIARNMPRALQRPFEDWLIPLVQETRKELGADWTRYWRAAGAWRFWIGSEVLGGSWQRDMRRAGHEQAVQGGAITGVLLPSADRHGRDFPLVVVLSDALARLMPPPVTTPPDRGWYDLCDDLLYAARSGQDITAVEAALDRLPGPILPEGAEDMAPLLDQRALWAQIHDRADDGTGRIWQDIALADHQLAASHRSYWWQASRAGPAQRVLTLAGLPDSGSFAFMLAQGHPDAPAPS